MYIFMAPIGWRYNVVSSLSKHNMAVFLIRRQDLIKP